MQTENLFYPMIGGILEKEQAELKYGNGLLQITVKELRGCYMAEKERMSNERHGIYFS
nr:MAG TPA: hypothetical protein [Caudoviricetes sp.]